MDEPKRKPPHAGERLTREDVLRLIEEHGGPEGLDLRQADLREAALSKLDLHRADLEGANLEGAHLRDVNLQEARLRHANLRGADLRDANLRGADLWCADLRDANLRGAGLPLAYLPWANLQGADLFLANLQRAFLPSANLQGAHLASANLQGANLSGAKLQRADLPVANLQEAQLWQANLQEANLLGAKLQRASLQRTDLRRARLAGANLREANLEGTDWGDYVLGEEGAGDFDQAASAYRALKQCHTEAGMYDIAGEFHYREMEARRKLAWKERRYPYAVAMYALRFLYGYGERPERVVASAAVLVFGLALVHWLFGTVAGGFLDALYFSAVSFPALGYGDWSPEPQGWAGRFLGAGESFLGVFMMALFLVTFTRKMTR